MRPWSMLVAMLIAACVGAESRAQVAPDAGRLRACGQQFVDASGRVVILRGINLSGNSKVPPFLPIDDPAALDPLPKLGFNVVRLVFTWEGFEPRAGCYDVRYLDRMRQIAADCAARGLYVIVDVHQDGYARCVSYGSGDGFPHWAASPRARRHAPDNGPECASWPILMALDPCTHRSFADFYADTHGVRTRYLEMLRAVARGFAQAPGVIGYDLLNEPWGSERKELAPLYADAARVIRAEDPGAILFLEGHVSTNCGLSTRLPRPAFDNVAYAPHYYKPPVIFTNRWGGGTATIDLAFKHMRSTAESWDAPLFLGEFGAPADARRAGDYLAYLYDRLDDGLSSGAQWNYTPGWTPHHKDGWNGEDFNILDPTGRLRDNFRPRPFPRVVAGRPCGFRYVEGSPRGAMGSFLWDARPDLGETEVFLPDAVFPPASRVEVRPSDATWRRDPSRQVLTVRAARPGLTRLTVTAP